MTASTHPLVKALMTALTDASLIEKAPADTITVTVRLVEPAEWPDSCLGRPRPDEACAEVLTPGYRIELAGGHRFRSDLEGNLRREHRDEPGADPQIRLWFTIIGGVGGWHTEYETDSHRLRLEDKVELRRLIDASDFFAVVNEEPETVIMDGFTRTLTIEAGENLRNEVIRPQGYDTSKDSQALNELFAWAEARTPPIRP